MAYPLIILGAGASFDYLRADDHIERRDGRYSKYRSPLMNQLFDEERFYEILNRHSRIGSFATEAMNAMSRPNANFEEYLTNARDNLAKPNPAIYSQLVSLIFYLADLFSEISLNYYHQRNHYVDLFQKIDNYCGGQGCIVNFNYDLLLEKSLCEHLNGRFDILKVDDYINGKIKIIKIHGACNWRYNPQSVNSKQTTAYDFFSQFSEELITKESNNQIYPVADRIDTVASFNPEFSEGLQSWTVKLPAIALPLKDKTSNYVCNESHVNILKNSIKMADRVLIIGWRGADNFLLNLLKEELQDRRVRTVVVTKNTKSEEIIKFYESAASQFVIDADDVYANGFSEFMKSEKYEDFFTRTEKLF